ncbi:MAG: CopD family protein [Anaerolineaceae bacterium]|nr:CopD family protein [Anaerolineaceae bacterium]
MIYALHLLATVIWVGGLASLVLLVAPSARRTLEPGPYAVVLAQAQRRLQVVGWFALTVLTITGLFQMSANPNYKGFLAIANPWAVAILLKHLTFGGMILVSGYVTWGLNPALQRVALQQAAGREVRAQLERLHRRERGLLWINLALAGLILAFTALARAT